MENTAVSTAVKNTIAIGSTGTDMHEIKEVFHECSNKELRIQISNFCMGLGLIETLRISFTSCGSLTKVLCLELVPFQT